MIGFGCANRGTADVATDRPFLPLVCRLSMFAASADDGKGHIPLRGKFCSMSCANGSGFVLQKLPIFRPTILLRRQGNNVFVEETDEFAVQNGLAHLVKLTHWRRDRTFVVKPQAPGADR